MASQYLYFFFICLALCYGEDPSTSSTAPASTTQAPGGGMLVPTLPTPDNPITDECNMTANPDGCDPVNPTPAEEDDSNAENPHPSSTTPAAVGPAAAEKEGDSNAGVTPPSSTTPASATQVSDGGMLVPTLPTPDNPITDECNMTANPDGCDTDNVDGETDDSTEVDNDTKPANGTDTDDGNKETSDGTTSGPETTEQTTNVGSDEAADPNQHTASTTAAAASNTASTTAAASGEDDENDDEDDENDDEDDENDAPEKKTNGHSTSLILGIVIPTFIVLAVGGAYCLYRRKKSKPGRARGYETLDETGLRYSTFDMEL